MAYCPRCRSEFPDGVRECLDCHVLVLPGRRPRGIGLDLEDAMVPVALALGFLVSMSLLVVRMLADTGRVDSPVALMIANSQPPCLSALFAISAVGSAVLLVAWLVRTLLR